MSWDARESLVEVRLPGRPAAKGSISLEGAGRMCVSRPPNEMGVTD